MAVHKIMWIGRKRVCDGYVVYDDMREAVQLAARGQYSPPPCPDGEAPTYVVRVWEIHIADNKTVDTDTAA